MASEDADTAPVLCNQFVERMSVSVFLLEPQLELVASHRLAVVVAAAEGGLSVRWGSAPVYECFSRVDEHWRGWRTACCRPYNLLGPEHDARRY